MTTRIDDPARAEVGTNLRRAVLFMSASSFLVPAAGLLTQPVLARALGAGGRGELAAAVAPATLAGAVATMGLPDALTYLVAKDPRITRRALLWSALLSTGLGIVCVAAAWQSLPFLSAGDDELARMILLAMALTIPALVIGALRGAAIGHQMWRAVAVESLINTSLRVVLFVGLWLAGRLTPLTGMLVYAVVPLAAGLSYLPVLGRDPGRALRRSPAPAFRPLVSYGSRVWFGAVASMLMAKTDQVLMAPLAGVRDLGLYSVANTVTDVPLLVAMAIGGAVQGVNSKNNDPVRIATTTRVTLLLTLLGSVVLGATSPWWIVPVFGAEFTGAVLPTLLLFVSALLCVPALVAGAGLPASGRPGLRSAGVACTCVVNVVLFVALVRPYGVLGACITSMVSGLMLSVWMVFATSRVTKVPAGDFVLIRLGDVALARREGLRILATARSRVAQRLRSRSAA